MTTPAPSDLMVRLARRFDAWPRELRWLVFLPAGIAAAFLVSSVLEAVLSAVGLRAISAQSTEGLTRGALLSFVWALSLTFVSAALSPRPWAVGLVVFAVNLTIRIAPLMMLQPYQRERMPELAVAFAVVIGAHAVGGGVALYLVRELMKQPSKGVAA